MLAAALPEIADRCLAQPGPFADRATAQLWAEALIGQVTCDALAPGRDPRGAPPRPHSPGSGGPGPGPRSGSPGPCAGPATARPEERLVPTAVEADALVARLHHAIGDVEQTLAGEEEELDLYLRRVPGSNP